MAWSKNGTNTLTGSASDNDITGLTAKKFNLLLSHNITTGTDCSSVLQFNSNTNSVYALRYSNEGGTDGTSTSRANWWWGRGAVGGNTENEFSIWYIVSISGEEKLGICFSVMSDGTGAANGVERLEEVAKFVPSPDADITEFNGSENGSDSLQTDSNISALGTD